MTGVQTGFDDHSVHFALPETRVTSDMFLQIDLITNKLSDSLSKSANTTVNSSVPEPGTLILLAIALVGLGYRKYRRTRTDK